MVGLLISNIKNILELNHIHQSLPLYIKDNDNNNYQFILKMMKAGIHFGHKIRKWNPKMSSFIYQKLQGIHIIDIVQSYAYLKNACKLVYQKSSEVDNYSTFLFVGTQKQSPIPNCILYNAFRCNSFFINKKWLSGMLTNWENTRKSINTLNYLRLYQKTKNFSYMSMKTHSIIEKKRNKLERYFGGIQNMQALPDLIIIVGQQAELNAARECKKLSLQTITILDTDCNPELAESFIPANDDSSSSLNLILGELQTAINIGRQEFCKDLEYSKNYASIFQEI